MKRDLPRRLQWALGPGPSSTCSGQKVRKKKGSVTRELIEAIMKGTLHIEQPFVEQIIA